MNKKFLVFAVSLVLAMLAASSAVSQEARLKTEPVSANGPMLTTKERLEQIRKDARKDFDSTASALRAMNAAKMNEEDRASWVRLSREAAVRVGDRDWLLSLKAMEDPFNQIALSRVLLAGGFLNEGEFSAAHAELAKIKNFDRLNTRDKRRYWALKARLAQLEGKPDKEREALEHIVGELPHWTSFDCQSCHDDPKSPNASPLLEVQNAWFAKRYVELIKEQGDAEQVRRAAQAKLNADPKDLDARFHLAYALLALGQAAEAAQRFREIPWVAFPDRAGGAPRMMFAWP